MPELTPEQQKALIWFLNKNISKIVSDDENFGALESLLNLEELGKPQGFDSALQKLKETHDLASELPDFLTFKVHGDFNKIQFQVHSRGHDYYFMVGAEKQPSGFSTFTDAYLGLEAFIPYTEVVLHIGSAVAPSDDTSKMYWYGRFIQDTDYRKFNPEEILESIKAYDKIAHILLQEKPKEEKGGYATSVTP